MKSNHVVTCDAATTKRFAGVLLNSISAKGNVTMIQEYGRIGGLFAGTATKTLGNNNQSMILRLLQSLVELQLLMFLQMQLNHQWHNLFQFII
jgi:hypothetical protein